MKWKIPPIIKIYEALGCVADKRISVKDNTAKVKSSDFSKTYDISYDPQKNAIMVNDNGSYWHGYLGYPAIAFLMLKSIIKYDQKLSEALKDIEWKKINTANKNDFDKTLIEVILMLNNKGFNNDTLQKEINSIENQIVMLDLNLLGEKTKPPQ